MKKPQEVLKMVNQAEAPAAITRAAGATLILLQGEAAKRVSDLLPKEAGHLVEVVSYDQLKDQCRIELEALINNLPH